MVQWLRRNTEMHRHGKVFICKVPVRKEVFPVKEDKI